MGGDFNAHIGAEGVIPDAFLDGINLCKIRKVYDSKICLRGKQIIEFMEENDLFCLNGRSVSDVPGKMTFLASTGKSSVDFIWVNSYCLPSVLDFEVVMTSTQSDHFPVAVKLESTVVDVPNSVKHASSINRIAWDDEMREKYSELMLFSGRIQFDFSVSSIEEQSNNFKSAITDTAKSLNMLKKVGDSVISSSHRPNKMWYDKQCKDLKCELDDNLSKFKESGFKGEFGISYLKLKKKYANLVKAKKKLHVDKITDCMNNVGHSKDFWAVVKKFRPSSFSPPVISLDKWYNFYQKITPTKIFFDLPFAPSYDQLLDSPISHKEILDNISKLKNNKAAGPDEISNEFLKFLPSNWILYLETLFNKILEVRRFCLCSTKKEISLILSIIEGLPYAIALQNCSLRVRTQLCNQ